MKILTVTAHYDDLELAMGGTVAKFQKQGHTVWSIVTSNSSYTNFNGKTERTKDESIKEGYKALGKILTLSHINLGYNTKEVPFNSDIIERLDKCITEFKPDIIITHHLNDSHQDHINTVKSVLAAGRRINTIWMIEPLYPSNLSNIGFSPNIYVDISKFINVKIKSVKAHRSQLKKYGKNWVELIKNRAGFRGQEIGKKYAECFQIVKMEYK